MTGAELRGGIRPLLFPRSVAVVGASDRTAESAADVQQVLDGGAPTWFVNPNRPTVLGRECFASLSALPEQPECAYLLVGHTRAEAAFEDAIAAGVRAVVLPGLGAEAGAEGRAVAARIGARAAECDVAVVGPNCMGVATPGAVSLWLGTVGGPEAFVPGHVSCVAHSGSVGEAFLACGPRVGFRTVVSAGSELSRDIADFVGYLAEDEGTRAIGLFVETIRRPDAFAACLARAAEAGKPVVCLKVGRSQAAARAALAHSGAVVGSARAFSALLKHHGALEVGDFHELLETLEVLGRRRWPRGLRIAAVSESGGECGLLADHGEEAAIPFAPFERAVQERLVEAFPNFTQPENPLDCWAIDAYQHVFPGTLAILRETGSYDVLLAQLDLSRHRGDHEEGWCAFVTAALADAVEGTGIFAAVTSVHATDPPPAIAELARGRDIALLRGTREGLRAIAAVARWSARPRPVAPPAYTPAPGEPLPAGALAEHDSCTLLERYGLTFPARVRCASPHEAASAFDLLGGPVVVKVDGPAHKVAAGGVALGISSAAEARDAAERMGGRVLVARQVAGGAEAFCGMTRDPDYGPVLAVGLGGRAIEALGLAAVALAPLDADAARALVAEAPGLALVASPAAVGTLAGALVALSQLAADRPEVEEVDINPLILGDDGAIAVDALVVAKGAP
ncbi:MAG TPA: acetate--CoA ligase family protein [Gaiellales bacterium]|nr:acetate--CoA ligase family protein [Gaiellales bacterium]